MRGLFGGIKSDCLWRTKLPWHAPLAADVIICLLKTRSLPPPPFRPLSATHFLPPVQHALLAADVIICTPEKWDGISRNWQSRSYVRKVREDIA